MLVAVLFVAELLIGALVLPHDRERQARATAFGIFLLAVSYQPLLPVAAALVAAPFAKFITKEPRSLRFMESIIVGIVQYFVWLSLFVALTYIIGGFNSASSATSTSATPEAIIGLVIIDLAQLRRRLLPLPAAVQVHAPPPAATAAPAPTSPSRTQTAKQTQTQPQTQHPIVDKMDEASARDAGAKDPTA